jgi:predicted RND superfamily exporter protein
VIDFGWMMSIGVTVALVLSFVAFPIIMRFLPKAQVPKFNSDF